MSGYLNTLILLSAACVAHAQLSSPRLQRLQESLAKDPDALTAFWSETRRIGTPLVEEIEGTEDVLVTFLLQSESAIDNAVVFASVLPENNPERQRLTRLSGTNVWFRTYRFHRDVPILYELSTDGQSPDQPSRSRSGSGMMEGCQQMMAAMEKRKADMKAMNDQLRQELQQMNAAEGQAKIAATAAVVNDLAAQHLKMHEMMMSISEQRMGHMMGHMGDAAAM